MQIRLPSLGLPEDQAGGCAFSDVDFSQSVSSELKIKVHVFTSMSTSYTPISLNPKPFLLPLLSLS